MLHSESTPPYTIRKATLKDSRLILDFIKALASYEKLIDEVSATVEDIEKTLFCTHPRAEVIFLEEEGKAVGFSLFYYNYSTFLTQYGIYVEDLFVKDECRGKGYGKALLKHICQLAKANDCGRVEWQCLDWNKSSVDFYLKLGAKAMSNWSVYRLQKEAISTIADAV